MFGIVFVDIVDDRSHGRTFTVAGRTDDENNTVMVIAERLDDRWQIQGFNGQFITVFQRTHGNGLTVGRNKEVQTETDTVAAIQRGVNSLFFFEFLQLLCGQGNLQKFIHIFLRKDTVCGIGNHFAGDTVCGVFANGNENVRTVIVESFLLLQGSNRIPQGPSLKIR